MSDGFVLKYDFIERWGRISKPEHLQIYIYLFMRYKKDNTYISLKEAAEKLHIKVSLIEEALDFWATAGYITYENGEYTFIEEASENIRNTSAPKKAVPKAHLRMRPSYTQSEIDAAASVNEQIDFMFKQAENILGKLLSTTDIELLYSFVDWLGLPVEVVIMLLTYAARLGKTDKRYLETLAINWSDREINTYEAAEIHIKEMEEIHSNEWKIRSILGIYDRALTQTEKKYIKIWTTDKKFSPELVTAAYERTVNATGKLSWAYMNKILLNWAEDGIVSPDDIQAKEEIFKIKNAPVKKRAVKASKFNNYTDTNKHDYSNFAEQILQDMLDE